MFKPHSSSINSTPINQKNNGQNSTVAINKKELIQPYQDYNSSQFQMKEKPKNLTKQNQLQNLKEKIRKESIVENL